MLNLSSALSHDKVLDFSHLLVGPFATQKLVITLRLAIWHGIEINDLLL